MNSLKKAKETIRSLRFQLSQTEEKLFSKTGGGRHNNGHNSAREQQGHLAEDWASIRDRNEGLYRLADKRRGAVRSYLC